MLFARAPKSVYGPNAVFIEGELTRQDCQAIDAAGISKLVITDTTDLSNLPEIKGLKALHALCEVPIDLTVVSELSQLQSLYVGGRCSGKVSFAKLQQLEILRAHLPSSRRLLVDLALATKLREAHGNFKEEMLLDLTRSPAIETLSVSLTRFKHLDWLEGASPSMRALKIERCTALEDLGGLRHTPDLLALSITDCRRIATLASLSHLKRLALLQLDDCGAIDTLAPVAALKALKVIRFVGTEMLDGRISLLDPLKDQTSVQFLDRAHYDRQSTDFDFSFPLFKRLFLKHSL